MVEKTTELTGLSSTSIEGEVSLAVARTAGTISGIYEVQASDIAVVVEDGAVDRWLPRLRCREFSAYDC